MLRRDPRLPKYLAFTRLALREALAERGGLLGRFGFYALLLVIFSRLWLVAHQAPSVGGTNAVDLLWYLAITEWIVVSVPVMHLKIEEDVRSGNLAYLMGRPVSYPLMRFWEGVGTLVPRLVVLGLAGLIFSRWLAGGFPSHPEGLWIAIPLGICAALVSLVYQCLVGLSAFWLHDATPIYWVWQKSSFLLGGLILPLSLYPKWLQVLAHCTPFSAILYGTASAALSGNPLAALETAGEILCWGVVGLSLLLALYRRGTRKLDLTGG